MRKIALYSYFKIKSSIATDSTLFEKFSDIYKSEYIKQFKSHDYSDETIKKTFDNKIDNFKYLDTGRGLKGAGNVDKQIFDYYFNIELKFLEFDIDKEYLMFTLKELKVEDFIENVSGSKKRKFIKPNYEQNDLVGRKGEEIVNDLLRTGQFEKTKNWVQDMKIEDFIWINEEDENGFAYDFKINNRLYDVKTTTTNADDDFHISPRQLELIIGGKLEIIRVKIDKNSHYSLKEIFLISNKELNSNIFIPNDYIYKSANKNTK